MTDIADDWTNDEPVIVAATYRRSSEIADLFGALAKAQASYDTLEKTKTAQVESRRTGAKFSYTYATLADTIGATRALHENGIAVLQIPTFNGETVSVTTLVGHASGQWIESTISAAPVEITVQSIGSTITFLRRYSRQAISGIAPEDDDGAAGVKSPAQAAHPFPTGAMPAQQKVKPVEFRPQPASAPHNPETGELLPPHDIDVTGDWIQWGGTFVAAIKESKSQNELGLWSQRNVSHLKDMALNAPKAYLLVQTRIKEKSAEISIKGALGSAATTDDLVTEDDASSVLG
jgi:hypothetical protein